MEYRPLGGSGLMVSAVGLGCNAFGRRVDQDGLVDLLRAARDTGVTLLDTADIYGGHPGQSEEMLGEALRGQRDEFVVATKFGMDMQGANGEDFGARGSRRYVRRAVEASLRRLQTDHIDLYQLHRPDPLTPIGETLEVLTDLVREGKVLYVGCSNFDGWQVADASWTSATAGLASFVSVQNEYSLLDRTVENEVTPACERFDLGLLPFFPLARGLLTGKYQRGAAAPEGSRAALEADRASWLVDADWDRVEALQAFAADRGLELLDVAIGGLAAQPQVASVISGVTSAAQVERNARAVAWQPSLADLAALDEL
ncbi:aldo/keto reductase [Phycicoccus sp. Root101]|uniref:aldo/keto reductase n=1 Tax=Phycicoccus sp. Root101 TaxID=1736421 RepID=UPI001910E555|nr:aldo/keto reductase [Phycicoccus sp. Root101]